MHNTIKYYNDKFDIDGIQFPNTIVLNTKPEYACDETIKELFYKESSGKNQITYRDETIKELGDFEPFYNELILLASYFEFEYKELLYKETNEIINRPKIIFKLQDLFNMGLSDRDQKSKIKLLEEIVDKSTLTDEFYFSTLNRIKKKLLKESDWTQLPDVQYQFSEEQKQAWIEYRVNLRILDDVKKPLKARIPNLPSI